MMLSILSCRKDNKSTLVKGIVQDITTSNHLSGATVYLMRTKYDCIVCQGAIYDTTTADENGRFSFEFNGESEYGYSICAKSNKYFNNFSTGGVGIEKGKKNQVTVRLYPEAYLKLHIIGKNGKIDLNAFSGGGHLIQGINIDTIFYEIVYGNYNFDIVWWVTKNDTTHKYSDNLICPAFDTTTYDINY